MIKNLAVVFISSPHMPLHRASYDTAAGFSKSQWFKKEGEK